MAKAFVTWLKIGVVLELIALAAISVLVVFDLYAAEAAQGLAVKVTLGIAILALAGGILAALLGKPAAEPPKGGSA